ncbi:MAG: ribonuclease III [Thermodesulfobacteria bacterium]|nr:ribonuclease III [Thermodesulfobacteriota bacterium]
MAQRDYLEEHLSRLKELERALSLRLKNMALYLAALTHRSYVGDHPDWPYGDNERLEFLGDAVLSAVVSHLLYERYGEKYREGELTKMRAWLVNEERLAKVAEKLGLPSLILLGTGEEVSHGRKKPSILAGVFEAVVAAIYLDHGFERAFSWVKKIFSRLLPHAPRGLVSDYKTVLQEYTQALFKKTPSYDIVKESGPEHAKTFWVAVKLEDEILAEGKGRSKKAAEQEAAKEALKRLEEKYGTFRGKRKRNHQA